MNKKQFHDAAMAALQKAKEIRSQCGEDISTWEQDKKDQFNAYMQEFATNNDKFEQAKKAEEQFKSLDEGLERYTTPAKGVPSFAGNPEEHNKTAQKLHRDALRRFIRYGATSLSSAEHRAYMASGRDMFGSDEELRKLLPAEHHALLGTVDSLGGFLVDPDFNAEFVKELPGFTVVRPIARVKNTMTNHANFMTVASSGNAQYTSGLLGSWRGEGWVSGGTAPPTQNQPRFGRERVPIHIWSPDVIELTMELLEDSSTPIEAELRTLLAEVRGQDEDSAFLLGTGVGTPRGIIQDASDSLIDTVFSGAADGQSYGGLVNLYTSVPSQYRANGTFVMNSLTLGLCMQLESTVGTPVFPQNTVPTAFFGRPIATTEFLADGNDDTNLSMIFGDFRYYGIGQRMEMRIMRLTERYAPNIGILAVARVGGQVLKTEPFRVQIVGANP